MATTPQTRSTLKHIVNVSIPFKQDDGKGHADNLDVLWVPICDGITELTEEFNPDDDEVQYICDDKKTTILKSYAPSLEIEMGYQKGSEIQEYFDVMSRRLPIGDKKNDIEYIRYNKNEPMIGSTNQYIGVLRGGTVQFSSIGGSAEDPLGSTMKISSRPTDQASETVGYVTVSTGDASTPKYVWTAANGELPFLKTFTSYTGTIDDPKHMSTYYKGVTVKINDSAKTLKLTGTTDKSNKDKYVKFISENTALAANAYSSEIQASGDWDITVTLLNYGELKFGLQIVDANSDSGKAVSVTTKEYALTTEKYVAP